MADYQYTPPAETGIAQLTQALVDLDCESTGLVACSPES